MALSPLSTSDVDDTFKWTVTKASGGGYIITNKGTEDVLLSGETGGVLLGDPIPTSSSDYRKSVWATAAQSYYVNLTSFTVSGGNTLVAGDSRTISPNVTPSNATHTAAHWFKWESSDPSVVTVDANGRITGITEGTVTITVTHKLTNQTQSFYASVAQLFSSGIIHTIKNHSNDTLIQSADSTNGSPIVAEVYNYNNTTSMWSFEYVSNGFYKIRNDVTGYYLTAPNNDYNNAHIIQTTYSSDCSLWMIQRNVSGCYTIQSKNQYERTTNTPLYLAYVDGYLVQSSTATTREWDLKALTLNLNLYYDQAFQTLYASNGISAVTAIQNIVENNTTGASNYRSIAQYFKEEFGIQVNINILPTVYESFPYMMDCIEKHNPSAPCNNCKDVVISGYNDLLYCQNGHHHKSATQIVNCTPESDSAINAMLTGHMAECSYWNGEHDSDSNLWGLAEGYRNANRCAIFFDNSSVALDYDALKRVLAHEILHLFNVHHHYDSEDVTNCIHGDNRYNSRVCLRLSTCIDCKTVVNTNKLKVLYYHNP